MQKGPKPAELTVTEQERKDLEELVRRHRTPQQLAKRGRMIAGLSAGEQKRRDCQRPGSQRGYGS